ncbi:MAG: glycosyltransferase family 9 protein [Puniceicoccales bacterium]|nr:glycosyltransferase family 9 protein [Puniceicoccales bacterium]
MVAEKDSNSRPRLLVVKPSSLGDIVHALQVIAALKEQMPQIAISWVVRDIFADVVCSAKCVDQCIVYQRGQGLSGLWRCCQEIRRMGQFDWVWDMQGLFRSGLMAFFAKSAAKFGRSDSRECSGIFYDRCIPLPRITVKSAAHPNEKEKIVYHAVDILREFLPMVGAKRSCALPKFHLRVNAKKLPPKPYVVIAPESRGKNKNWDHYEALTSNICRLCPQLNVVWVGLEDKMMPSLSVYKTFFNFQGNTSLMELMAIIQNSSGVIANDSGCLHIAVAMNRPALGIFTTTDPRYSGPRTIGGTPAFFAVNPPPYFPELKKFFAAVASAGD